MRSQNKQGSDDNELVVSPAKKPSKKGKSKAELISSPEQLDVSSRTLAEILQEASQPRVDSDEQLAYRFQEYFQRCIDSKRIPTIEECMVSTGYSVAYMTALRDGQIAGPQWATMNTPKIISWACDVIMTYDAKMVMQGILPQIPYIYRSKNFYGMQDKPDVVQPKLEEEQKPNLDEIAKRYMVEGELVKDGEEG